MSFVKYCPVAEEKIEWTENMALDHDAGDDGGGCPPPCARWHFEEPLFEGKLTIIDGPTGSHDIHDGPVD